MDQAVYTPNEYCREEKISRTKLYDEWARGEGVDFYRRGNKVLISHEARVRHREKLERLAREEREAAKAAAEAAKPATEAAKANA